MTTPVESVLLQALGLSGHGYLYGAEADYWDPSPDVVDCSELVEWACNSLPSPVEPHMPDGSWLQARHCDNYGRMISVGRAIITRGALLFRFSSSPLIGGRPRSAHVALSLGNGSTIEARGLAFGVGSWTASPAARGWTMGATIPGVDYTSHQPSFRTLRLERPPMFGTDVGWVQERLVVMGYGRSIRVPVDGVYGPMTRNAVVEMQHELRLDPDGVVGPLTWAALQ